MSQSPFDEYYERTTTEEQEKIRVLHAMQLARVRQFANHGPIGQAKAVHTVIDQENKKLPTRTDLPVTCTKGCSFCCHLHVVITHGEAEMLAKHIKDEHLPALAKQMGKGETEFRKLPYADKKCIFLQDGECTVYEDRPSSCRKYLVASKSKLCDTEKYPNGKTLIHISPVSECMTAALMSEQGTGSMATLLYNIQKIKGA